MPRSPALLLLLLASCASSPPPAPVRAPEPVASEPAPSPAPAPPPEKPLSVGPYFLRSQAQSLLAFFASARCTLTFEPSSRKCDSAPKTTYVIACTSRRVSSLIS